MAARCFHLQVTSKLDEYYSRHTVTLFTDQADLLAGSGLANTNDILSYARGWPIAASSHVCKTSRPSPCSRELHCNLHEHGTSGIVLLHLAHLPAWHTMVEPFSIHQRTLHSGDLPQ